MSTELREELIALGKEVAISVGLYILGIALGGNLEEAFLIACIPYGWRVLNMITPSMFIWMPFIGWVIYFIMKAVISALIGIFVLVYRLIKGIYRVIRAYRNQKLEIERLQQVFETQDDNYEMQEQMQVDEE